MQTLLSELLGQVTAQVPYASKTIRRDIDDVSGNDDDIERALRTGSDVGLPEGAYTALPPIPAHIVAWIIDMQFSGPCLNALCVGT